MPSPPGSLNIVAANDQTSPDGNPSRGSKPAPAPPASPKKLPRPEDFVDPEIAEAVRAMLEALRVGGGVRPDDE